MASSDLAGEMEVEAYRRLFPLPYYERHLAESVRPDARPLARSRDTTVAVGAVASADGSSLVKVGDTTMLAAIKLEVMTPAADSPDQGSLGCIKRSSSFFFLFLGFKKKELIVICVFWLGIEFHMPPICSPLVRPGRPAEVAPVISKQISDVVMRFAILTVLCFYYI